MNFLTNLLGVFGSGFNSLFGLVTSTMQKGFQAAIQFHKEGVAFARETGLSAKQAQAYTETLIQRTQVLANKYGVSAEAIAQVQRGLSEATGKQLMLNDAQAEGFVQINKLVGAQNASKFTEEIMNGMGGQIDTVQGAISKVYATAAKQGLNAKKLTDKVAQNLGMANRLSFRDGVNGLTRMAAYAEKVGMNMSSVETAAGQFLDLDKAIENAAQMQMLGGSAAANFGNPLTAAYEANYDPEAFAKRMSDSLGSYATFDASKGVSSINGMNMDFVRNIAKTMGISVDEASKMAKKQAEVRYKETALGGTLDRVAGGDEAKRNYILNNAQVTNGGKDLEIQGRNINSFSEKEWEEMMKLGNMSNEEIMREQALHLTSIDEQISGAQASVTAAFADGLNEYIPDLQKDIQGLGEFLKPYAEAWGKDTGKVVGDVMRWIDNHKDGLSTVFGGILSGVTKVFDFLSNHWQGLLAAVAGWKLLVKPLLSGALSGGGKLAAKAAKGTWGGLKKVGNALWSPTRDMYKYGYTDARIGGSGKIMSAIKAPFKGFKYLTKAQKLTNIGGAALGVGLGAYNAISSYSNYKDKKKELGEQLSSGAISQAEYNAQVNEARKEKNAGVGEGVGTAIGATIGTFIGGPIGTAVGGWLGSIGGKLVGENWDEIAEWFKGVWDGVAGAFAAVGDWFKDIWNGAVDWVKGVWNDIGKAFAPIGDWFKGLWDGVAGAFTAVGDWFKDLWNGVGNWFKGVWNGVAGAFAAVGDWFKDIWNGVGNWFKGIGNGVKNIWNGTANVVKGFWQGVKNTWNGVGDWFKGVWNGVAGAFAAVGDWFKQLWQEVGGAFTAVGDWFKEVWQGVVGAFTSVGDWFKGVWNGVTGAFAAVGDWFKGAWDGAVSIFTDVGNWLKGAWETVTNFFKKIGEGIAKAWAEVCEVIGYLNPAKWVEMAGEGVNALYDAIAGDGHEKGGFINSGARGVEHPVLAQRDEVILNPQQQKNFMSLANDYSSVLTKNKFLSSSINNHTLTSMMPSSTVYGDSISKKGNTNTTNLTNVMPSSTVYGDNAVNNANTQNRTITSMMPSSTVYGDTTNSYMNSVTSVMPKTAEVKSKPVVGENAEYIYKPNGSETSTINGNTITVKDFNINLSGTLKLDAGNMSKNIDMNALLNDYQFINGLKAILEEQINRDMNNGRWMNDDAVRRGQTHSLSIIG